MQSLNDYLQGYIISSQATNAVWQGWVTSTATNTNYIWQQWQQDLIKHFNYNPIPTPDNRWIRRLMYNLALAANAAIAKQAEETAEALLLECCDKAQRRNYGKSKSIVVKGQKSGHLYVVRKGQRVAQGDKLYCIHPTEHVPQADTMLAQKLMIETDEEEFLKTANMTAA